MSTTKFVVPMDANVDDTCQMLLTRPFLTKITETTPGLPITNWLIEHKESFPALRTLSTISTYLINWKYQIGSRLKKIKVSLLVNHETDAEALARIDVGQIYLPNVTESLKAVMHKWTSDIIKFTTFIPAPVISECRLLVSDLKTKIRTIAPQIIKTDLMTSSRLYFIVNNTVNYWQIKVAIENDNVYVLRETGKVGRRPHIKKTWMSSADMARDKFTVTWDKMSHNPFYGTDQKKLFLRIL